MNLCQERTRLGNVLKRPISIHGVERRSLKWQLRSIVHERFIEITVGEHNGVRVHSNEFRDFTADVPHRLRWCRPRTHIENGRAALEVSQHPIVEWHCPVAEPYAIRALWVIPVHETIDKLRHEGSLHRY
jgi:hypothetical protein